MNYRYNKEDISGSRLTMGTSINRGNCLHLPELIGYAQRDVRKAEAMPHATVAMQKAKELAIAEARQILEERQQKLDLYKEIFPDLFRIT